MDRSKFIVLQQKPMLHGVATSLLPRAAAAFLALALSGAAHVGAQHAPARGHHCSCKHDAEHECDCGSCRRRSLEARASDDAAPPCHRAAARKALAEHSQKPRSVPCVDGGCGGGGDPTLTMPAPEPYVLRTIPGVMLRPMVEPVAISDGSAALRVIPPETPPPRLA
jgi:hypothetical protein